MPPSKTLIKFCKIANYIKQIDPELYQVFDDLCLMHLLKPARGANGVTFIYPKEKSYRTKIVNAAYSSNPEVAIDMLKALCLQDFYPNASSFKGTVVNLLNQKLAIAEASDKHIKLADGLELKSDEKFKTMGYRENMAVYTLTGKGEMSLKGDVVPREQKAATGGGWLSFGQSCVPAKKALQNHCEKVYSDELTTFVDDNVYVKKVWLQLKYIITYNDNIDKSQIAKCLGNDEFSDSFLLDIYCAKKYPKCFKDILDHLTSPDCVDKRNAITRTKYIEMRRIILGESVGSTQGGDNSHLSEIKSPVDIRQKVFEIYGADRAKLAKDIFIVYCNVSRDLWNTDVDHVGQFKNFAFIAQNIYDDLDKIINQEFDIARDLTLYGNLLKSDVLNFSPKASYEQSPLSSMPSPLDMKTYSLSSFINRRVGGVTGGAECNLHLFKDL